MTCVLTRRLPATRMVTPPQVAAHSMTGPTSVMKTAAPRQWMAPRGAICVASSVTRCCSVTWWMSEWGKHLGM